MEKFVTELGQALLLHKKEDCKGYCCIHNPSNHHMREWPLYWRCDRRIFERIDPEGCGHPDPDDAQYRAEHGDFDTIHGYNGTYCGPSIKVKGFEKYFVTPDGGVYNAELNIFMKPHEKNNYLWVQLNESGRRKYKSIHRLVAEAYIPNPENKRTVNHKDFNTFNNIVENLEWATDSENIMHSSKHGRRDAVKIHIVKLNKARKKLNETDILLIFDLLKKGFRLKTIADKFEVHRETIGLIKRGRSYLEFQHLNPFKRVGGAPNKLVLKEE